MNLSRGGRDGGGDGAAGVSRERRPLLFLDVDGPLIPFGPPPPHQPDGFPTYGPESPAHPLLSRMDPAHGPRLAALPCELVWATTWMADANDTVAPRLGLPELPVVAWPDPSPEDAWDGLHWKTRPLVAWADGRPFVWVDDETTATDRAWVSARHPAPALLHRVDPGVGLLASDVEVLATWLRRVIAARVHPG